MRESFTLPRNLTNHLRLCGQLVTCGRVWVNATGLANS